MVFYKCWFSKAQNGYQALMHWRARQIISQPKHPDLNVNAACLQRHLHSICFCGGRIPLVLEVRVEEEASLSQLWEHKKIAIPRDYPLNQKLGPFSLWLSQEPPGVGRKSNWAGQKAPVCNHKGPLQKRECIAFLDQAGWFWLCFG